MSEPAPMPEGTVNPEKDLEVKHDSAISKLLNESGEKFVGYVESRINKPELFIKDSVFAAGGILIGLGLWQLATGEGINIYKAINVFQVPQIDQVGQMIADTDPGLKIISGVGTIVQTAESNKPKPTNPNKIDPYLVKAYVKDFLGKLGIGGRKHE